MRNDSRKVKELEKNGEEKVQSEYWHQIQQRVVKEKSRYPGE